MNWYKKAQNEALDEQQKNRVSEYLDSIPLDKWQEINDRMCAMGYDFQGAEDTKTIFKRLMSKRGTLDAFEDHKKVFDAVVAGKEYIKKQNPKKIQNVFEKAIKYLGLTNNLKEAGYILPDGKYIDLSGLVVQEH